MASKKKEKNTAAAKAVVTKAKAKAVVTEACCPDPYIEMDPSGSGDSVCLCCGAGY